MDLRFYVVWESLDFLLAGALLTLQLVGIACILGVLIGIVGAFLRRSPYRLIRFLVSAYVEVFRNTPLLVQLYFVYFGLPSVGIDLDSNTTALIALTLNAGGYMTEIVRAGLDSIHARQVEAGFSLGMNHLQVFRYVILPPAMRTIAPALGNQFILMTLASAIVAQVSAEELTFRGMILENRTFRSFEVYLVILVIYFAMAQVLYFALNYMNRRLFRHAPKQRLPGTL